MQARNKSLKYFTALGLPDMSKKYHHHTTEELKYFRHQFLYNPDLLKNRISNFMYKENSSYPWILVTR